MFPIVGLISFQGKARIALNMGPLIYSVPKRIYLN